ncbi:hypothetical protein FB451DRAFT_1188408 [Mycena latifolia]|nr:hypothetical protein FB451DRAFT_1188408 [Mycena latifolia]
MSSNSEDSTEDIGEQVARAFIMPKHNATIPELMAALKASNKAGNALLVENKRLQAIVDKHEASKSGRKTKNKSTSVKGNDVLGYHEHIIHWGKSFALMVDPWVSPAIFSKKVNQPVALPADIFKDEKLPLYQQYLTATLYERTPEKYHQLLDRAVFGDFSFNFLHNVNAGRSTAISVIKNRLPLLLLEEKFIEKMDATNLLRLLLHPTDNAEKKISNFPPILYPQNRLDRAKIFLNRLPMLVHRMILFGPTSVNSHGKQKPQSSTLGVMWGLQTVTSGSVAFSVTATVFVIYWLIQNLKEPGAKEDFFEVGSVSKIGFRRLFMRLLKVLKTGADTPGIKRAMRTWNQTVFYGITTATTVEQTATTGDVSLEDLEDVMAGLDQVTLSDAEYAFGDEEADNSDIGAALTAVAPPRTAPAVLRPIAPPPPVIRRPTSRPGPNEEEEEADDLNTALSAVAVAAPAVRPARPAAPPAGQPVARQPTSRSAPKQSRIGEYYDFDSVDDSEPILAPSRPAGRRNVCFIVPDPESSDLSPSEGSGFDIATTTEPVNRRGMTTARPTAVSSGDNNDGFEIPAVEPVGPATRKTPAAKGKTKQKPEAVGDNEQAEPVKAKGRRKTPPAPTAAVDVDMVIEPTEVSGRPRRSTRRG